MADTDRRSLLDEGEECPESIVNAAEDEKRRGITRKMKDIMADDTLTAQEKSRKCQELLVRRPVAIAEPEEKADSVDAVPDTFKCATCHDWLDRPVTMPCQHNFCLGCVTRLDYSNNQQCPTCRAPISKASIRNVRINTALNVAIRVAKNPQKASTVTAGAKAVERIGNDQRPDEAYVTDRAQRAGRANAASGRVMVTVHNHHFGPITAEDDPTRNRGVLVGDSWEDRLACRQWGAHFPHVAGIAGQSDTGAQSIVLAGGYEEDLDIGEYILYTGSGGRDLSGNKRTNKVQGFDQDFTLMNEALRVSCTRGLPVRVVRSHKEKRSPYAPKEKGVRYDGVYRIVACWRKPGGQEHLVCRFLLTRCDNEPAPWSSEEHGDPVREDKDIPPEALEEMKQAVGQIYRTDKDPYWCYDAGTKKWGWARESPTLHANTRGPSKARDPNQAVKARLSEQQKALKEFHCLLCKDVMKDPVRTPCGHNFCKACLDNKFHGIGDVLPTNAGRESLRVRKAIKKCPGCTTDICAFLSTAQVNRDMRNAIDELQASVAAAEKKVADALASQALTMEAAAPTNPDGAAVSEAGLEPAVEDEDKADEGSEEEVSSEQEEEGPSKPAAKRSRHE